MAKSTTPSSPVATSPVKTIASYDEYLATYFPKLSEQKAAAALSPQEFGVSMAKHSLARIKQALGTKGSD